MKTHFEFVSGPVPREGRPVFDDLCGAVVEFWGVVRGAEGGLPIAGLVYEAHEPMARRELKAMAALFSEGSVEGLPRPCHALAMRHSLGFVPAGSPSLHVLVAAPHRAEALRICGLFIERLKADVPIWKSVAETVPGERAVGAADLDELDAVFARHLVPLAPEEVAVVEAGVAGRTLAGEIQAPEDAPAFDRSAMDGYVLGMGEGLSVAGEFFIAGEIGAGDVPAGLIEPGTCWRVATGAAVPGNAGKVVPVEHAVEAGGRIRIEKTVSCSHLRRRGSYVRAGSILAPSGTELTPGALALLAGFGVERVRVGGRPRIAHMVTGSELVGPGAAPEAGQIRDTNSLLVRTFLAKQGYGLLEQHRCGEDPQEVVSWWRGLARPPEVLLISGGAGPGRRDHTRALLAELGFTIHVEGLRIKPGKPLIFGTHPNGGAVAFGLPGNPMSHFVLLQLAVLPALRRLAGEVPLSLPLLEARLRRPFVPSEGESRPTWWPARLELSGNTASVELLPWRDSGDLTPLARTNALACLDRPSESLLAGAVIRVLPIG